MTALTRLAGAAYERLSPLARRWLPASLKRRLGGLAIALENAAARSKTELSQQDTVPLTDVLPLLSSDGFADGPIVLVNNALAWGGAERQVVNTLRGLDQRLARPVGLICQKLGESADFDFHVGTLAGYRGWARNMVGLDEAQARLKTEFAASSLAPVEAAIAWLPSDVRERIWRLVADFTTLRPRVVHAWQDALSIEAGYAAKLAGVPCIIVSARNMAPIHFAYHRPYMQRAYLELAACPDIIMLNNSEAGARDYAQWLGITPDRYRILRNGIDLTESPPAGADARIQLGVPADAPLIGSIFRFYDEKNPMLWIETAAIIARARPDAHFVVYGVGPLLKEARALAAKHGFEQRFHTPGALPEAASMLGALDVFLLTSQFEGTPNVVLEASAAGVPVVATAAGGTAETVEAGVTGFVDQPNAEALAERVLAIMADSAFRVRCATAGPEFVELRFGLTRMIDETIALYGLAD